MRSLQNVGNVTSKRRHCKQLSAPVSTADPAFRSAAPSL